MEKENTDEKQEEKKPEFYDKFCRYCYSEKELRDLADEMAHTHAEIVKLEDEKKAVVKEWDGKVLTSKTALSKTARQIRDKFEMRQVRCEIVRNFDQNTISYVRTDNGELAEERAMTAAECQMSFDDLDIEGR